MLKTLNEEILLLKKELSIRGLPVEGDILYMFIYVYIYTCVCIYEYLFISMYMYMCIYIYIHIHINVFMCIHIGDILSIKDFENEIKVKNDEMCVLKLRLSSGFDNDEKYRHELDILENEMKFNKEEMRKEFLLNEEKLKENLAILNEKISEIEKQSNLIEVLKTEIHLCEIEIEKADGLNSLIISYKEQLEVYIYIYLC
jgi:hypothetical protein